LALHYLAGAITFDPAVTTIDEKLASEIVWFDCFITNVDRTVRNTNMLIWHNELWLIDHGASLYFHHSGQDWQEQALKPFVQVKDHVLLPRASKIDEADAKFRSVLNEEKLRAIIDIIPEEWLLKDATVDAAAEQREVYYQFLTTRLKASDIFVKEAKHAREAII
jgi:hypothetical protein